MIKFLSALICILIRFGVIQWFDILLSQEVKL